MTLTYADTLGKHNLPVPEGLAEIEVPVLTGPQAQGDVAWWPRPPLGAAELESFKPVPAEGVVIVRGTNDHILDAYQGTVLWKALDPRAGDVTIGILHVPATAVAYVTHTEEHTTNGIGPGTYRVTGKREMADEIRRVAD